MRVIRPPSARTTTLLFLLHYYDVDGKLFKSEHFEKISMVDNVPTVMKT